MGTTKIQTEPAPLKPVPSPPSTALKPVPEQPAGLRRMPLSPAPANDGGHFAGAPGRASAARQLQRSAGNGRIPNLLAAPGQEKSGGEDWRQAAKMPGRSAMAQKSAVAQRTPPSAGLLQRQCACGNLAVAGGECAECAESEARIQREPAIGASNDPLEQEAHQASPLLGFQPSTSKPSMGAGAILRAPASKAPVIGSKFVHPAGVASKFKSVSAKFDGRDFTVNEGSTPIMTQAAQSGKPISVRSADAAACGGSTADSYTNNPLYVGIQDFGAIPEGDFTVSLSEFSTFTAWEQSWMIAGGMFTDPFGNALHGGDWGAGRAPLHPKSLRPAPKPGCGDTSKRSGFYLHGGSLPGSSGCIDIDNSGINNFLTLLAGYKPVIPVKVSYKYPAPTIGTATRALGRFTYPTKDGKPIKDPSLWDRVKEAVGGSDDSPSEQTPKPEAKPPEKPTPAPKQKPKDKPKKKTPGKASGKRSGLMSHGAEELLAGDILDDDLAGLLLDGEEEELEEAPV